MTSNYRTDDPILGQIDLDDYFITDAWLVDQFVGGQLYSRGQNNFGQLGLGDLTHRSSPVQVGSSTDWKQISSVTSNKLSTKTDGTLWARGSNTYGNLGLGDLTHRSSPVQVGSSTDWKQISAGLEMSAAIKTDGTLWTWGKNSFGSLSFGSLGLGDTIHRSSPVQVGSLTNWKQIDCGAYGMTAIKTDGTLWTWGDNTWGQLGLGDRVHRSSPVQVGSLTNWKQVSSAGNIAQYAIKTDGTLWVWGENSFGALGLGGLTHRSSPVQVGSLTNWKYIVGLYPYVGAAIKTDGTLWIWGYNVYGFLGLGDTINRSSPVQVGSLSNWKQISSGFYDVTAIRTDGTLWTWGQNTHGNLGLGDIVHRSSPVQVGSLTNWKQVSGQDAVTYSDI